MGNVKPADVLLVEDNEDDVFIATKSLEKQKLHINLHVVNDGVEAMEYLHKVGPYADAVRPDLILLDLNMPRMDGRQVLEKLKSDENLRAIPVVVLTTSEAEEDIAKSYCLYANCYITKPVALISLQK